MELTVARQDGRNPRNGSRVVPVTVESSPANPFFLCHVPVDGCGAFLTTSLTQPEHWPSSPLIDIYKHVSIFSGNWSGEYMAELTA